MTHRAAPLRAHLGRGNTVRPTRLRPAGAARTVREVLLDWAALLGSVSGIERADRARLFPRLPDGRESPARDTTRTRVMPLAAFAHCERARLINQPRNR